MVRIRQVIPSIGYTQWLMLGYSGTLYDFFGWLELIDASHILYDNSKSGLPAGDVQTALDVISRDNELFQKVTFKDSVIPDNPVAGHYPETGAVKDYVDNAISNLDSSIDNFSAVLDQAIQDIELKLDSKASLDHTHTFPALIFNVTNDGETYKQFYYDGSEKVEIDLDLFAGKMGPPGIPGGTDFDTSSFDNNSILTIQDGRVVAVPIFDFYTGKMGPPGIPGSSFDVTGYENNSILTVQDGRVVAVPIIDFSIGSGDAGLLAGDIIPATTDQAKPFTALTVNGYADLAPNAWVGTLSQFAGVESNSKNNGTYFITED